MLILAYLRIAYSCIFLRKFSNFRNIVRINKRNASEQFEQQCTWGDWIPPPMNTLVSPIALWPVTWCGCPSLFSLCRLNMAALLRSARLIKCSPAALLQVFGNSRHVSAAGRLYSGAVGTTRAGLCVQTVPGRLNVNRYNAAWLPCVCSSCSCHWKVITPITVLCGYNTLITCCMQVI